MAESIGNKKHETYPPRYRMSDKLRALIEKDPDSVYWRERVPSHDFSTSLGKVVEGALQKLSGEERPSEPLV